MSKRFFYREPFSRGQKGLVVVLVPNTQTRLSHALKIMARGRIVGAVHEWEVGQDREIDTEFEVEANSNGRPVDVVPQALTRREIRVQRYDTYPLIMEEVFGTSELVVLCDQTNPFILREVWLAPGLGSNLLVAGVNQLGQSANLSPSVTGALSATLSAGLGALVNGNRRRLYQYYGCYFQNLGRKADAKDNRVISVGATLVWQDREKI